MQARPGFVKGGPATRGATTRRPTTGAPVPWAIEHQWTLNRAPVPVEDRLLLVDRATRRCPGRPPARPSSDLPAKRAKRRSVGGPQVSRPGTLAAGAGPGRGIQASHGEGPRTLGWAGWCGALLLRLTALEERCPAPFSTGQALLSSSNSHRNRARKGLATPPLHSKQAPNRSARPHCPNPKALPGPDPPPYRCTTRTWP